ncbi:MAG: hypothetical protein KBB55_02255 [Candidatus Buchananbacteria bacterium]|nr:hypothetical protein [Candidatus Buchananbacteria bacterium]
MSRAQMLVKSKTKISSTVAVGVGILAIAAIMATVGPKMVGNFAGVTTVKLACADYDGVDYAVKGTVKATGLTLDDSCKDAKTLNEGVCDPIRKYANSVTHTCLNGCSAGKCNPATSTPGAPVIAITKSDFYIPITSGEAVIRGEFAFTITAPDQDVYIAKRTTSTVEYLVNKNNAMVWQTPIAGINQTLVVYSIDGADTSNPSFFKIAKGKSLTGRAYFGMAQKKLDGSMLPTGFYSLSWKSLAYRNSATATAVKKVELIDHSKATTKSQQYPSLGKPVFQE